MEKPSREEISKMFLGETGKALEISKEGDKRGPIVDKTRARSVVQSAPETKMEMRPFLPDVDFWEMKREEMIEELAQHIFDIRMSRDPEVIKAIPEINLDLSGSYIDFMLTHNKPKRITPGTEDAENFMRRWDRIQAEKWLGYLENQKKAGGVGKGEKVAVIEPAPKPKLEEDEGIKLNAEQTKKIIELKDRAGYDKLWDSLEKKYKNTGQDVRRIDRIRASKINDVLKEIVTFDAKDENFNFDYFGQYFLNPEVLKKYWEEMQKRNVVNKKKERGELKEEYIKELKGYAEEAGFGEQGTSLIVKYFNSRLSLEHSLRENVEFKK